MRLIYILSDKTGVTKANEMLDADGYSTNSGSDQAHHLQD
jgi:hypothetical protein